MLFREHVANIYVDEENMQSCIGEDFQAGWVLHGYSTQAKLIINNVYYVNVQFYKSEDGCYGYFNPSNKTVYLNELTIMSTYEDKNLNIFLMGKTLLHQLQHYLQAIEGRCGGTSSQYEKWYVKNILNHTHMANFSDVYDGLYYHNQGEIEARRAQTSSHEDLTFIVNHSNPRDVFKMMLDLGYNYQFALICVAILFRNYNMYNENNSCNGIAYAEEYAIKTFTKSRAGPGCLSSFFIYTE